MMMSEEGTQWAKYPNSSGSVPGKSQWASSAFKLSSILVFAAVTATSLAALLTRGWFQYRLSVIGIEPSTGYNVSLGLGVEMGILGKFSVSTYGGLTGMNLTVISNHFALGVAGGDIPKVDFDWWQQQYSCNSGLCQVLTQDPAANSLAQVNGILNPVSCTQAQNNSVVRSSADVDGSSVTSIPGSREGENWIYSSQCDTSQVTLGLLCTAIVCAALSMLIISFSCCCGKNGAVCIAVLIAVSSSLTLVFSVIVSIYYAARVSGNFDSSKMYIRAFSSGTEFAVYPTGSGGYLSFSFMINVCATILSAFGCLLCALSFRPSSSSSSPTAASYEQQKLPNNASAYATPPRNAITL